MRTPHRIRASRRLERTAVALAVAAVLGASTAQAATVTLATDESSLVSAINTLNQRLDCSDQVLNLGNGDTPFAVGISTPLPTITCPHLTVQGVATPGYGASLSYYGYGSGLPVCGIASTPDARITVQDLSISGFRNGSSGNAAGLCGSFDAVRGMDLVGNDNGILVAGPSGIIGDKVDINRIYGNSYLDASDLTAGAGIQVTGGGSAEIAYNLIGTWDGFSIDANGNGIILANNATVHDNTVSGNDDAGIVVLADDIVISGNKIGTTSDGANRLGNYNNGIFVQEGADRTQITGNLISANGEYGIEINGGSAIITGNTIGTDASGTVALGNSEGIFVSSGSATIDSNLISGQYTGIDVYGSASITRNTIGLDASGTTGMGGTHGIYAYGTGAGLVVSGNTIASYQYAIMLDQANGGTIQNNTIGVSVTGAPIASFSTPSEGIVVKNSSAVAIGDKTDASLGNVVAAQSCAGVDVAGSSGLVVGNNYIGVDRDGSVLGNGGYGVVGSGLPNCLVPSREALAAKRRAVGAPIPPTKVTSGSANSFFSNRIQYNGLSGMLFNPGTGSGVNDIELNTITDNGDSGIALRDASGLNNAVILGNVIFGNSPKNIELYLDPVTPSLPLANDAGDVDGGPNEGLNYPEVVSVTDDGTNTVVTYRLNAPTSTAHSFRVQFFTTEGHPGQPGGESLVGEDVQASVIGMSGNFTKTFPSGINYLSLTSTMDGVETSEFSPVATSTPVPAVNVTPAGFDFGNVEIGDASQPFQDFALVSAGTAPWTLNGLITSGTCAAPAPPALTCSGNFACTTTCAIPSTYGPGGGCNVGARFSPSTLGASSLTITVCDNTGKPTPIALTGNAVAPPPVTVTPNGYDFGTVLVGTSSAPQAFTVTNPAKSGVTLAAPFATPPFTLVSTTCASALAPAPGPGNTCTMIAAFTPSTAGVASGQVGVSFTSNATGTPVTATAAAAVAGVGATSVQLSMPTSLDVGTFTLGLPPPVATATVKNTTGAPAAIASITATSPFTLTHDCPATLGPGASCTLTLSLAGSTVGPASGSVSLTTASGVQRMALTGQVAQPAIALSPASIDFGVVQVDHVSAIREIAIINTTGVDVPISTPAISGPFRIGSSSCASPLPAHAQCSVQAQFTPALAGAASGALSLTFGVAPASSSTSTALSGTAMDIASLDMASLVEFGAYVIDSPAIVRTVAVTSSGNVAVSIAEISVSGPFALTHDCPAILAPGATCTLTLSFTSSTPGTAAGVVSIRSNAVGGLRTISLGALAQARPVPVIEVSPLSISFGDRIFGNESAPVTVTVTNSGSALAVLGALGVGPSFLLKSNTCGPTLAPGATCSASVAMLPTAFGSLGSALSFTSNAEHSPHGVSLDGRGCRPVTPVNNRSGGGTDPCSP